MIARELELNPDFTPGLKRLDALTYEERQAVIEVNDQHAIGISLNLKGLSYCIILSHFGRIHNYLYIERNLKI